jgi:hypothetical protein
MSAKKKSSSSKASAEVDPTRPTLTEDIIQIILEELKEQLQSDDLQGISKNIMLYEGLLFEDNLFKMDILGHNITRESRTEWETLLEQGRVKHRNWLKTIKLYDSFEIFNKNEKGWFPVKVIGGPENGVVDIHFNGWGKKYDTTVTLGESKIVPMGTFCASQKKNKVHVGTASASSSSSSAVVAEATSSSAPSNVSEEKLPPESDDQPSATEAAAPMEDAPALSRSGRVLKKVKDAPPAPAPKTVKKTGGGKKSKQIQKDFNDWICSICNMLEAPKGTELMCCDGPCRRSFHAECLDDENVAQMDSWLCTDCVEGMHSCFVCNRRGSDYVVSNEIYC